MEGLEAVVGLGSERVGWSYVDVCASFVYAKTGMFAFVSLRKWVYFEYGK
jgi:hypothetical protein